MLLKGCPCILSSPKLIGLEHLLAHSPGLIGMKHKHMERRRALAAGLTAAINVSKCNHIRRTCASLPGRPGSSGSCVRTGGDQPFPNKVRGNL